MLVGENLLVWAYKLRIVGVTKTLMNIHVLLPRMNRVQQQFICLMDILLLINSNTYVKNAESNCNIIILYHLCSI